jgi:hypothetical protein
MPLIGPRRPPTVHWNLQPGWKFVEEPGSLVQLQVNDLPFLKHPWSEPCVESARPAR